MKLQKRRMNKKGVGVVSSLVVGTIGLVFAVVVTFVLIGTVIDAGILTSGGVYETNAVALQYNLSDGVVNVGNKIPTILLIGAVVLLFGALVLLVVQARRMGMFGGGGGGI